MLLKWIKETMKSLKLESELEQKKQRNKGWFSNTTINSLTEEEKSQVE